MKGGVVAALHALAELREGERPEVVLQAVASEEDGGLGTFAALERDAAFDACLIPEPTGYEVVCAQAGALTFRGIVRGRAAHAAMRLAGPLGDRPLRRPPPARSRRTSAALNATSSTRDARARAAVPDAASALIEGGEWSSSVPDRVVVEGRLGVPVGARAAARRARRSRPCSTTVSPRPSTSSGPAARSRPARRRRATRGSRAVAGAVRAELGRAGAAVRRALRRRHAPVHAPAASRR